SVHAVLPRRVLARLVAEAAGRRHEDHPGGGDLRKRLRVVTGARRQLERGQAESARGAGDRGSHRGIERRRPPAPDRPDVEAETEYIRNGARFLEEPPLEPLELVVRAGAEL